MSLNESPVLLNQEAQMGKWINEDFVEIHVVDEGENSIRKPQCVCPSFTSVERLQAVKMDFVARDTYPLALGWEGSTMVNALIVRDRQPPPAPLLHSIDSSWSINSSSKKDVPWLHHCNTSPDYSDHLNKSNLKAIAYFLAAAGFIKQAVDLSATTAQSFKAAEKYNSGGHRLSRHLTRYQTVSSDAILARRIAQLLGCSRESLCNSNVGRLILRVIQRGSRRHSGSPAKAKAKDQSGPGRDRLCLTYPESSLFSKVIS